MREHELQFIQASLSYLSSDCDFTSSGKDDATAADSNAPHFTGYIYKLHLLYLFFYPLWTAHPFPLFFHFSFMKSSHLRYFILTSTHQPTPYYSPPRPSFHHHHLFMVHTNQAPHLKMKSDFSSLYIVPSVWKKGLWVFCSSTSSCGHKWLPWQPTVHIFLLQE